MPPPKPVGAVLAWIVTPVMVALPPARSMPPPLPLVVLSVTVVGPAASRVAGLVDAAAGAGGGVAVDGDAGKGRGAAAYPETAAVVGGGIGTAVIELLLTINVPPDM